MSMSGVQVSEEAKQKYEDMKNSKGADKQDLFLMQILKGADGKEQVMPTMDGVGNSYTNDEFREFLENYKDETGKPMACIAIFDFMVNPNKKVLTGLSWIPEGCRVKSKMVYAATLEGIKGSFAAVKWIGSKTDTADLTDDDIKSALPPSALK